jgi:exodeoxyribonuclease VII small subunit
MHMQASSPPHVRAFSRSFPCPFPRTVTSKKSIGDATGSPATEPLPNFERSLEELEAIVDKLEAGDLSLDESLAQFERGVALTRACQGALKEAEQKVEILLRRDGEPEPFDATPLAGDVDERDR